MTIFSKIISGQIPCFKIWENDTLFAFLDVRPHTLGHTLLVPKEEIPKFTDLPDELRNDIFKYAQKLSVAIEKAVGCERVGLKVHGYGVKDHFHLHLIPLTVSEIMDSDRAHEETEENMREIQQKILAHINF